MTKMIDLDAFIKQYCEDCGYGCNLGDGCCATVEDLMNFPALSDESFKNGKEFMRKAVLDKLKDMKLRAFGAEYRALEEAIEAVQRLEVHPR